MKKFLVAFVMTACCFSAYAGTQNDKMKSCNADATAKAMKGDERKAFMKDCLSSKPVVAMQSQQNKMKTCNADPKAKTLKGDERKAFMKSCLSNK
jgi:hypothetical protein